MRLIARIFALLLIPFSGGAQTAAVPALPVPLPAIVIPAQTIVITTSKQGGKVAFTIPSQTVIPKAATTAAVSAPIVLPATATFTFTCTIPSDANIVTNPDGTKTITNVQCAIKPGVTTP